MTRLAGRRRSAFWQATFQLRKVACTVLGAGPHFPLGMIIAHVALLTGARILRFFFGEGVTRMAFVAGIILITVAFGTQFFFLFFGLDAHVVAATAAAPTFDQPIRCHVCCRYRVERCPTVVVFALGKLR